MDINLTILGEFLTFTLLLLFIMRYVWPIMIKTIEDRNKKIADGLEAAEQGKQELEMAKSKAITIVREAKQQASHIIEQANLHSAQLVEDAKGHAKLEGQRIVEMAQGEIDREVTQAKEVLKNHLAVLAVAGAEKIIQRHLDPSSHNDLLTELVAEI